MRAPKRPNPQTPVSIRREQYVRHVWTYGTYNVGRNAAKRENRQGDIRARVAARAAPREALAA